MPHGSAAYGVGGSESLEMRNPKKFEMAKELGATDCVNPKDHDKPIQQATLVPLSRVKDGR